MEIWKDIPEYEGLYQVSNLGNVKNIQHTVERVLKNSLVKGTRYFRVSLCGSLKKENKNNHQLVAMAFLGHEPNGHKTIVDHINNNPLDNRVENLQLISNRENLSKDKKGYTSKYVGVTYRKDSNKWSARIRIKDKRIYLGSFESETKAHEAYKKALSNL